MRNSFYVIPTKTYHRKYAKGDYVIIIHKNKKKELSLGKFAVIGYKIRYFGPNKIKTNLQKKRIPIVQELRVHARVIYVDESSPAEVRIKENQVCIDQTIRNAIGIPYTFPQKKEKVSIYPIKMPWYSNIIYQIKYYIARSLGFRYLYFRVCSAHIHDMEKGIVRIPKETFPILGTQVENKIILENPVEYKDKPGIFRINLRSISAYELTREIKELRLKNERKPIIRYRNPSHWIKVNPDISRIFVDQADRERLGVDQLFPLKVRRNLFDLFKSQLLAVGIFFLISIVSISSLLPLPKNWTNFAITVILGALVSVILIFILLRNKIK